MTGLILLASLTLVLIFVAGIHLAYAPKPPLPAYTPTTQPVTHIEVADDADTSSWFADLYTAPPDDDFTPKPPPPPAPGTDEWWTLEFEALTARLDGHTRHFERTLHRNIVKRWAAVDPNIGRRWNTQIRDAEAVIAALHQAMYDATVEMEIDMRELAGVA